MLPSPARTVPPIAIAVGIFAFRSALEFPFGFVGGFGQFVERACRGMGIDGAGEMSGRAGKGRDRVERHGWFFKMPGGDGRVGPGIGRGVTAFVAFGVHAEFVFGVRVEAGEFVEDVLGPGAGRDLHRGTAFTTEVSGAGFGIFEDGVQFFIPETETAGDGPESFDGGVPDGGIWVEVESWFAAGERGERSANVTRGQTSLVPCTEAHVVGDARCQVK